MRLFLLILLLCLGWTVEAAPGELHVALWVADAGDAADRPAVRNGGLRGFNEALAREICRRINARCVMENVLFADILPGIESGRFDLGFGNFLRTPERERRFAFSDSIWSSSSRLLGRSENNRLLARRFGPNIRLDQLHDLRLGAVTGSQQLTYLESLAGRQGLAVVGARSLAEAINLLREGKVDFCLVPMLSAYELLPGENPGRIEFAGPPLVDGGLGGTVHIAMPKGREALRQEVNQAIAGLRADGSYQRLVRRHFSFSLE